jgi:hypothetical protein
VCFAEGLFLSSCRIHSRIVLFETLESDTSEHPVKPCDQHGRIKAIWTVQWQWRTVYGLL